MWLKTSWFYERYEHYERSRRVTHTKNEFLNFLFMCVTPGKRS